MQQYNLDWMPCAAHCIDLMFEDINKKESVKNVIEAARGITSLIYNHGWLLASMREFCEGDIIKPGSTRFAANFMILDSLLKKKSGLKKLFLSDEWFENKLSCTQVGKEIESCVLSNSFWDSVQSVVSICEPICDGLRMIESKAIPTIPIVYELFNNMETGLSQIGGQKWVLEIVQNRLDKTLSHPLHSAAYYLNPRYQYQDGVRHDPTLIHDVHQMYHKLFPESSRATDFGNELIYFRDAKKSFSYPAAIASRNRMTPIEWWTMYGRSSPTVRDLAMKILSQTASSSTCERDWDTFALHNEQKKQLANKKLEQLVFCYYNMKLKMRDMELEVDNVAETTNYLDLLDIEVNLGEEDNNPLLLWIRPTNSDDTLARDKFKRG